MLLVGLLAIRPSSGTDTKNDAAIAPAYEMSEDDLPVQINQSNDIAIGRISRKLDEIIIPKLILTDATPNDAVAKVMELSREYDLTEKSPSKKGIAIRVKSGYQPPKESEEAKINLILENKSLRDVVHYITAVQNLAFDVVPDGVVMRNIEGGVAVMAQKRFYLPLDFFTGLQIKEINDASVRDWLKAQGLFLPVGSSVSYNKQKNTLTMRSIPADFDLMRKLVSDYRKSSPSAIN